MITPGMVSIEGVKTPKKAPSFSSFVSMPTQVFPYKVGRSDSPAKIDKSAEGHRTKPPDSEPGLPTTHRQDLLFVTI
jgi:hypothetical protein